MNDTEKQFENVIKELERELAYDATQLDRYDLMIAQSVPYPNPHYEKMRAAHAASKLAYETCIKKLKANNIIYYPGVSVKAKMWHDFTIKTLEQAEKTKDVIQLITGADRRKDIITQFRNSDTENYATVWDEPFAEGKPKHMIDTCEICQKNLAFKKAGSHARIMALDGIHGDSLIDLPHKVAKVVEEYKKRKKQLKLDVISNAYHKTYDNIRSAGTSYGGLGYFEEAWNQATAAANIKLVEALGKSQSKMQRRLNKTHVLLNNYKKGLEYRKTGLRRMSLLVDQLMLEYKIPKARVKELNERTSSFYLSPTNRWVG